LTVRIFDTMKNGMTNPVADSADAPSAGEVASPPASDASKKLLPWLVAVAFFMESLDTTVLNTAVPAVSQALHVAPLSMKAVLASYTLSLAVFIPISGWMADRFGTRHVFAAAIGLFTLGSFLCGISSDIHLLVACRLLQGCGGAMMVPVGRLTLVRTFAKFELIRVMSFVAIPALIGPMFGPLLGGLILRYLDWRYVRPSSSSASSPSSQRASFAPSSPPTAATSAAKNSSTTGKPRNG
jgi:MFS family permease